jgi:thiol-disulfide isomerase/thioredoxin
MIRSLLPHHLATLLLCSLLLACGTPDTATLHVQGIMKNAAGKKIMLAELPYTSNARLVVDSATLDSSGRFQLQTVQSQESVYQLFVVGGPGLLFINDVAQINIEADAADIAHYRISGSPASRSMQALYTAFVPLFNQLQQARQAAAVKTGTGPQADSLYSARLQQRDAAARRLSQLFSTYLAKEKNATAQYFALGLAREFLDAQAWANALDTALSQWPQHPGLRLLQVKTMANRVQGSHLLNKPVPELVLPDTSGRPIALSSFRGRWLFIDCWASWCGPCRAQNPRILAAYRRYNRRNLSILGVSLDKNKAAWQQAIITDTLPWQHVSDLKYWDSQAVSTFGITALPFNLLVDPTGIVRAVNVPDSALEATLAQYLQ